MKQLVELQEHADDFKSLNTELVFVFREEAEGVAGLKKIKDKHNPPYLLALDFEKKSSKAYSPKQGTYDNYVVDANGTIRAIVDGTLMDRAKSDELLRILREIEK